MKRLTPPIHALVLSTALLLAATASSAAAATPAGTAITNQAQAELVSPRTNLPETVRSNVVTTTVQAVCAVSVTPNGTLERPGQALSILPGEGGVFRYTLTNAGNDTFTVPVSAQVEAGSAGRPAVQVVRDLNGNGRVDAGEPEVSGVSLAPDASAALLLVVGPVAVVGETFVNLTARCGEQVDSDNVSVVRVGPPPVLSVDKTFAPERVRPNEEATVTVRTVNTGQGASREVTLTDLLDEQLAQGLSYVPGSARASTGTLEFTQDGRTWSAQETQPVRGVRVRAGSLAAGQELTLTFRMRAGESAENRQFRNVATAATFGQNATDDALLDVRYTPGVAIGPVGNPEAPEATEADRQARTFAAVGQVVCFDHTARNTGDVRDDFTVTVTYPQGTAGAALLGVDGQPLAQPLTLDPGQTALVRVCYDLTRAGPLEAKVTINGARGTSNATTDVIGNVEPELPRLVKSVRATTTQADGQIVDVPAGRTVQPGDLLTYTLTVTNPYARPLSNVVISDPLPAHVDFQDASDGGKVSGGVDAQNVTWALGTLAPGETRNLTVSAKVSDRAQDNESLNNTFGMVSTEFPAPLTSNEVRTPVWKAKLIIVKEVSAPEVTYGDLVTYTLRITNSSETSAIVDAEVIDTPPPGLVYVPGTSTLEGAAISDPATRDGQLIWPLKELGAGQTVTFTYVQRVTPQASGQLVNLVMVTGNGAGGVAKAIASNRAEAVTKLNPLKFAPLADILGIVFVDRNRDGRFDEALDTPLRGARVLLAGGREALTDTRGRYSFTNVPQGTHALRLDPVSAPYVPLYRAQDGGLSGTQTVYVRGLTSVDFPLAPLGGDIVALRRTTLRVGDVKVEKAVYAAPGGYTVQLTISSATARANVSLLDPLPTGATLKEGRNTYSGSLPAGELRLTYTFEWNGTPEGATTDPELSWR